MCVHAYKYWLVGESEAIKQISQNCTQRRENICLLSGIIKKTLSIAEKIFCQANITIVIFYIIEWLLPEVCVGNGN